LAVATYPALLENTIVYSGLSATTGFAF